MKRIILVIFLLNVFEVTAQDLDKIKDHNVFFILFDNEDVYVKKIDISRNNKHLTYKYVYYYTNKEENKRKKMDFSFIYSTYWTFDDAVNNVNKKMVFSLNKSFLRKNKDIIITRQFMEKMGHKKIINLLYNNSLNQTIFLINTADTKNGKILVREVRIDYVAEE